MPDPRNCNFNPNCLLNILETKNQTNNFYVSQAEKKEDRDVIIRDKRTKFMGLQV